MARATARKRMSLRRLLPRCESLAGRCSCRAAIVWLPLSLKPARRRNWPEWHTRKTSERSPSMLASAFRHCREAGWQAVPASNGKRAGSTVKETCHLLNQLHSCRPHRIRNVRFGRRGLDSWAAPNLTKTVSKDVHASAKTSCGTATVRGIPTHPNGLTAN